MKLKLFLFLASALLAGRAMAQCSTLPFTFPAPGTADKTVPSGTCLANVDAGTTGQGGRLRWNNNNSHELQLFDADDQGQLLWCANNSGVCATGGILCAQQDGNLVMYSQVQGQPPIACHDNGNGGSVSWSSRTQHKNDGQEALTVDEDISCNGATRTGDRAVVRNGQGIQWCSTGYTD
jgi:hypothetical protein